jgi:3-oxoacyl-[acyl-carrier-protein] synthase-3
VTLHFHGLGHFHPEIEISNRFLEELDIGTTEAWIVERVGIRSRRTTLPLDYIRETRNRDVRAGADAALYDTAEMGCRAARHALARAGIEVGDVGLVLSGSCATDFTTPAEASEIAGRLGIRAPGLDVHSACTSFVGHVKVLEMMRPEALPDFVLLVVQDAMTRLANYDDRATAVLFGDAAAAAVVSPRIPGRAVALTPELHSDPSGHRKVAARRGGFFRQDGRAVQMFAIKKTLEQLQRLQREHEEPGRPFHFIGHQANLRVLNAVCERAGIPPERHHRSVELFGNTGAPSSASVLSMEWEKLEPRDDVALVGVGAGLAWGGFLLRFGADAGCEEIA